MAWDYSLTEKGYRTASLVGESNTLEARIIKHLAKQHHASREKLSEIAGGDMRVVIKLMRRGIITKGG